MNQIEEALRPLAKSAGLTTMTVFGGVGQNPQVQNLRRGTDIVLACPGRLEDLMGQGHCDLGQVEITILDEADHMADLGFLPGVRRILAKTPRDGQRLLFSATLDKAIDILVKQFLQNPVTHQADSAQSPVASMDHHVLHVNREHRVNVLVDLTSAPGRTVVFTRTKYGAKALARQLNKSGVPTVELHGNLSQGARTRNMDAFHSGKATTLVATDIAARGIHVDDVALVVHADPPVEHKAYLHRSGRTARAGNKGTVVTLMTDEQVRDVRDLTRAAGIKPTLTKFNGSSHAILAELAPGERAWWPGRPASRSTPSPAVVGGGRPAAPAVGGGRSPARGRRRSRRSLRPASAAARQPGRAAKSGRPSGVGPAAPAGRQPRRRVDARPAVAAASHSAAAFSSGRRDRAPPTAPPALVAPVGSPPGGDQCRPSSAAPGTSSRATTGSAARRCAVASSSSSASSSSAPCCSACRFGIEPGNVWFYPSALALAATWAVGAFASGPVHLGGRTAGSCARCSCRTCSGSPWPGVRARRGGRARAAGLDDQVPPCSTTPTGARAAPGASSPSSPGWPRSCSSAAPSTAPTRGTRSQAPPSSTPWSPSRPATSRWSWPRSCSAWWSGSSVGPPAGSWRRRSRTSPGR